jgi:hypothetical protein
MTAKHLFGKIRVFFYAIVQTISLKMLMKSVNYCQTINWRKKRISTCFRQHASKCPWKVFQILVKLFFGDKGVFLHVIVHATCSQITCCSKQFVKHFTAKIGNLVRHFTINKFSKMSKLQTFSHLFCYINTFYENAKKKVSKSVEIACTCVRHLFDIFQA